jgi:SAM-dependent methyltransferase
VSPGSRQTAGAAGVAEEPRDALPARLRRGVRVPGKVARLLAYLPALRAKELIYSDAYFAGMDRGYASLYELLADTLYRRLHPASAIDVGCGTGLILARLAAHGVDVRGIEGSRHAIRRSPVPDRIVRANLERGVPDLGRFDLCMCIEVAEHLPGRCAAPLVEGLTRSSDTVVFTAATPGQGGDHHVNEQPRSYWLELFGRRGFWESTLAHVIRSDIARIPEPWWIHANLTLLARGKPGL